MPGKSSAFTSFHAIPLCVNYFRNKAGFAKRPLMQEALAAAGMDIGLASLDIDLQEMPVITSYREA